MSTQATAVLVHGAFADASGYAGVIRRLQAQGVPARAPMNPLRGLASDAEAIRRYTTTIEGPIVLVGHSYGGAVISQAAPTVKDVRALVFLSAFAVDEGETCVSVAEPFPPRCWRPRTCRVPTMRLAPRLAQTCSSRSTSFTKPSVLI